jgi:hypothetical protein
LARFAVCLALLGGTSALLLACGSNGATTASSGDGGGPGTALDGAPGGSNDGAASGDGSSNSAADGGEGGTPDSGPVCFAAGATEDSCRACCEMEHPQGYQLFAQATLVCACEPQYCGPLDGGTAEGGVTDAGDAGAADGSTSDAGDGGPLDSGNEDSGSEEGGSTVPYGQGVCSAGTCAYTEVPSDACSTCIYQTIGTLSHLGPCAGALVSDCITNSTCDAYFSCVEKCPGSQ